jgi:hypothetical protein
MHRIISEDAPCLIGVEPLLVCAKAYQSLGMDRLVVSTSSFLSWNSNAQNLRNMVKTNSIHEESIAYISNNINTDTSEIPTRLLAYWHTPECATDYIEQSPDLHSFFIFQHAFDTYNKTLGKKTELSSIEAMALFEPFQIIIGVGLGKENGIKIDPINLFDFDNYSKLNITIL